MATRERRSWKLDSQGHYARQIGWKLAKNGKRIQHKFRLGSDLNEAKRREEKLRQIWESVEHCSSEPLPVWTSFALDVAKRVAKGECDIVLSRSDGESELAYASRIQQLQSEVPVVRFVPGDVAAYSLGQERRICQNRRPIEVPWVPPDALQDAKVITGVNWAPVMDWARETHRENAGTLHQAMRDFIAWIEEDYYRPHLGRITDYGRNKIHQVKTLMTRHDDVPLTQLDYEEVERMVRFWRQRPPKKDSEDRITVKSASNYIGELRRFFAWLHRSNRYPWRKPDDFDDIDVTVDRDHEGKQRKLAHTPVFTLDELVLLNRYATPLERVMLLLGLNCGFGAVEIATLTIGDLYLFKAHSRRHREILDFDSTNKDSFIKRVRRKNGVYGEFLLFPQTVEAIQWSLERRYQQPDPTSSASLLLNSRGEPYDKPTKSGNRNQQIPNRFEDLLRRIRDDDNEINKLSFGKLRKTAGDLIRRFSDGEIAGVFLMHGQAVDTDDLADVYTNRPFGKVFKAILRAQEHLGPMFAAAGPEPFKAGPQAYTSRKTVDRIVKLHDDGLSIREIAAKVGKSTTTVHRHIQKALDRETPTDD